MTERTEEQQFAFRSVYSSCVDEIAYDEKNKVLAVIYNNGRRYHYLDVPRDLAGRVMNAPSVGEALAAYIKKGFRSERR